MRLHAVTLGITFFLLDSALVQAVQSPTPQSQPQQAVPLTPNQTSSDGQRQVSTPSSTRAAAAPSLDYRVGADDLLTVNVLEAPELNGAHRVTTSGQIALSLVGVVDVSGLTIREIETRVTEKLRKFVRNPHVTVHVTEMRSHAVSVVGAVRRPGVIQVTSTKTLLEVISLAEGLAEDAGEFALVMRGGDEQRPASATTPEAPSGAEATAAAATSPKTTNDEPAIQIRLRDLMESGDPRHNVMVYPGDVVKITQAGVVYVVGEVNAPGSFVLPGNGRITILQALALGKGLTPVADKDSSIIVRTDASGGRREIPVDLAKVLKGKQPEVTLQARDVLFVPNSRAKSFTRGTVDALVRLVSLRP